MRSSVPIRLPFVVGLLVAAGCTAPEPEDPEFRGDPKPGEWLPPHPCTSRPILDVSGALDLSSGDVSDDLEAAIDAATMSGWAAGLPPGTYPIGRPLNLPGDAVLIGSGESTVLEASIAPGAWAQTEAMVEIVGVNEVTVCDLVLDHQGGERVLANEQLSFTMLMANTNGNLIDGVVFKNPGAALDQGNRPSGPALLMLARQPCLPGSPASDCDVAYFPPPGGAMNVCNVPYDPKLDPGEPGDVTKNVVRHSRFELSGNATVAFAIRMYTDFCRHRPADQFTVHAAGNAIHDNTFIGDFAWNTVELAGAGTDGNSIEHNEFDGRTLTHVDFDKGARNNVARANRIIKAGRSGVWYGASYGTLPTFAIADHGDDTHYLNFHNTIVNNTVESIQDAEPGGTAYTGGIGLAFTTESTVQGNRIDNLYDGLRGYGVLLFGSTQDMSLIGNVIGENGPVSTGIFAPSSTGFGTLGLQVVDNVVDTQGIALSVGQLSLPPVSPTLPPPEVLDLAVVDNRLTTASTGVPAVWIAAEAPFVSRNEIVGGNDVVQLASPGALLEDNRIGGAAPGRHALQISRDATLNRNSAWGGSAPPPHPHCQVATTSPPAVVTMGSGPDANDFTCP